MAPLSVAAEEFGELARNLRAVGAGELRDELYKAVNDAVQPVADQIKSLGNLRDHMPDPYADVLAGDLQVSIHKKTGPNTAGVTLLGRAPTGGRGGRKVRQREAGIITHPLFGNKERWFRQTAGMKAGFFTDPVEHSGLQVREAILAAIRRVGDKATGKG